MIGVIDYGAGNLGSVMNALKRLCLPARFTAGPEELAPGREGTAGASPFDRIIFPGDGHFAAAMEALERTGYAAALREWIAADRPFLGICIGLQLLFESSEEADMISGTDAVRGLSVIAGKVRRFPGRKVPQIGWNQTKAKDGSRLFKDLPPDSFFYYIHSYYADPADTNVTAAETKYYLPYCSAVEQGELAAVQFHPEKSGAAGIRLLENWAGP